MSGFKRMKRGTTEGCQNIASGLITKGRLFPRAIVSSQIERCKSQEYLLYTSYPTVTLIVGG